MPDDQSKPRGRKPTPKKPRPIREIEAVALPPGMLRAVFPSNCFFATMQILDPPEPIKRPRD
jgi:hypothetical protein